jgi:hypothetical protein
MTTVANKKLLPLICALIVHLLVSRPSGFVSTCSVGDYSLSTREKNLMPLMFILHLIWPLRVFLNMPTNWFDTESHFET